MEINLFFEKVIKELNLGDLIEPISQVSGGLTHRMFKVFTNKGKYIIKLLNPQYYEKNYCNGEF